MGVEPAPRPPVLIVTHNYPRDADDQAGQFIYTLIHPIRHRYRFIVVAPHHARLPLEETRDDVTIVRFRYGPDDQETLAYEGNMHEQVMKGWGARFAFLRFLRAMRQCVAEQVETHRPVSAHIHWWVPGGLAAAAVLKRKGVPYILTTHGSDVTLLDKFKFMRPVAVRLFKRAAAATAVSTYLRDRLKAMAGVEAVVLPMPYDESKFTPRPAADLDPPVITCIGRFIERKGQPDLLRACGLLRQRGVSFRLKLVGDGPLRPDLERLASDEEVGDRIEWTGNIPHRDIPSILEQTSVAVLPSVQDWKGEVEGLGMVLVEASACGRPVVGTDLAGVRDAVEHEHTGLLVAPNAPAELANALERILADRALARRYGEAGIGYAAQHFSPRSQSEKLAAVIDRVARPV